MNLMTLAARNLTRNKTRVVLTIIGVAMAVLFFILIRTIVWSWEVGAEQAKKDRIVTRHKVTFVMPLPLRYATDIREALYGKGIKQTTWANWFGGKDPKDEKLFFGQFAVDHKTYFQVYDDAKLAPGAQERWNNDPQGAILGIKLAKKMGVKEGDKVTLLGSIFPGTWEFRVAGTYTALSKSVDEMSFFFRWDYLNNRPGLPPPQKDQIGWMASNITDPSRSAEITRAVDKLFEDRDNQTLSQSERDFYASFLGMLAAVFATLNFVAVIVVVILMLILGNTIAMGVRERTYEHGVLRALGFQPGHITAFIVSESVLIGLLGGALGVLLGAGVVSAIAPVITENFAAYFSYFQITAPNALFGLALGVVGGAIAALIPAYRASKLQVVTALRRVG